YVVLDVNENPANLTINSSVTDITSYDTIYFNKGDTVQYSFTVDVPDAKKVEVTVNGNTVSSQGKEYTANLLNGANIIGINATAENGKRKSYYQVIDARKMEIIIANKTNPEKPLKINDKANISFKGITPPIYKLATIYNPTWRSVDGMWEKTYGNYVEYRNEHFGEVIGVAGQWDLATNNDFDITIDKEGTFTFSGGKINGEWWGEQLGTDKKVKMLSQNTDANINSEKFCVLPDFSITIGNEVSTNVPVKGITLNKTEVELKQGETFQLQAMVTPQNATNKTVSWSTSGKYFVTVDTQGKITAVNASTDKVPEVVITAKTNDGEFIATCKVVVTSKSNQSDKIAAERVMQQISALFPVTLKSEYAINYVKAEYNKLTAEQKKLVTNINDLYLAENILIKLKQDEKQKVNPKDQKVAEDVIGMISALKDITMDSEGAITDAIKAYNKLTVEQKKLVTNIVELFQAENKLLRLKLEAKPNNNDKNKTDINISAPSYNHKEDNIPSNPISEEIQTIQVPESATQQTVEIAKKINDNLVLLSKDSSAISPIEQNMLIKLVQEYIALPEEQKILVPYCEKVENFIESIKSSNQQDKKTGIKVDGADWFIGINVNSATDSPRGFKQVKKIQEQIGNNELLSVWDISLNNIIDNKE
ncbi:MAG: Ig-like domain-containing protein, partial [Oscillospiraceae bacterium]